MKWLFVFSVLFVFSTSWARISDGQVHLNLQGKKLVATVKPGFHFNKDAPASLVAGGTEASPSKKEEPEFIFEMGKVKGPFKVSFYVCDDKKTVCEEHTYDYQVQGGKLVAVSAEASKVTAVAAADTVKAKPLRYDSHGFVDNNFEAALAKAKKEKKLLFVDYGAPWCPACIRLETEVFGTPIFKKATKNVIKLALNSDLRENKAFGEKYKIKVLPTMLILDVQGNELYRDINFRPAAALSSDLTEQFKKKTQWADIEKKAEAGDKEALKMMASRALSAFDMEGALKWHEKLAENSAAYAFAETAVWADKDLKDEKNRQGYIAVLKKWIAADPNSYTAIMARNDWAKLYEDKKIPKEVESELKKNTTLLKTLAEDTESTHKLFADWGVYGVAPYEREEIFSQWLSSAKALKEDTKELQVRLQGLLKSKDLDIKRPGEILEGLQYFRQTEMANEEEAWLVKLTEANPQTYVYHMKLAGFYKRQKNFAKALPEAQKAVELGEERRMQNLQTLAQIQKELSQKEAAKVSVERALALPEAKLEQYKSLATSLEELKKSL